METGYDDREPGVVLQVFLDRDLFDQVESLRKERNTTYSEMANQVVQILLDRREVYDVLASDDSGPQTAEEIHAKLGDMTVGEIETHLESLIERGSVKILYTV